MIYALLPLAACLVVALYLLSRANPLDMRSLAMHPFNLLGIFIAIICADFMAAYAKVSSGFPVSYGGWSIGRAAEITSGFIFVLIVMAASIAAIFLASYTRASPATTSKAEGARQLRASRLTFMICGGAGLIVAFAVAAEALRQGQILKVAASRQLFFVQNPMLNIAVGTLFPAFVLFGAKRGLSPIVLLFAAIEVAIQILVGARGQIFAVLIALGFWGCQRYRFIPLPVVYAALPVVGFASVLYRYVARDHLFFSSFQKFLEVNEGVTGIVFNSVDLPLAEINSIVVNNEHVVRRAPWDWFLGAITAPIPRSWIPWKPLGPSSQFTLENAPQRFILYRSELIVTGPGGLYFDVGYIGAVLVTAALAYLWARVLLRQNSPGWAAMLGPIAIMVSYQFLRNDLYNTALMVWPMALTFLIYSSFLKLSAARAATAVRRNG